MVLAVFMVVDARAGRDGVRISGIAAHYRDRDQDRGGDGLEEEFNHKIRESQILIMIRMTGTTVRQTALTAEP